MWVVGQEPQRQQAGDDKFATNERLRGLGLPVAASVRVGLQDDEARGRLTDEWLERCGLTFPVVVKPVRGRGSQGVSLVKGRAELTKALDALLGGGLFGDSAVIEQYLSGTEITVTVLANPRRNGPPVALPPVRRFNHVNGVAPYNGTVAVTSNSAVMVGDEMADPAVITAMSGCTEAFEAVGALAPIRIDCRADGRGVYRIFDLNMKPNMTGSGRPGRDDQDGLTTIASHALGWSYGDLLRVMLGHAWKRQMVPSADCRAE